LNKKSQTARKGWSFSLEVDCGRPIKTNILRYITHGLRLAQNRDQWQVVVNMAMNLQVS
jgi:hypothetical protein